MSFLIGKPNQRFTTNKSFFIASSKSSGSLGLFIYMERIEEKKKKEMSEKRNIRDHKRRLLAAKYELRRKLYKAFCKDSYLPSDMRDKLRYKLSKLPRNSSFARVRNRCISTGRPRSVYEFFRISRIVFRGLASRGPLMGIKKSSW